MPRLDGGSWVQVGSGWLTSRAEPKTEDELLSWAADVIGSCNLADKRDGVAARIVEEAVSAGGIEDRGFPNLSHLQTALH